MLKAQRVVQVTWLLIASPLVAAALSDAHGISAAICAGGWTLLLAATVLLWRRPASGVILSAALAFTVAIVTVPVATYNAWAFAADHPRYVDSPATIYVVGLISAVTCIPAVAVLLLSAANRSHIARQPVV